MSTYSEWTQQIGDQWVAALKRAEEVVTTMRDQADTADLPPVPVPDQVSQLTDAVAERLPDPSEIVEANFALTSRLLAAQRELTLKLLGVGPGEGPTDKESGKP
ncbi:MAG: hypothetical protein L0K86_03475 [Actinomycetia bacterium]|nr:hypothetical protein [Actinomycetes bacterium]